MRLAGQRHRGQPSLPGWADLPAPQSLLPELPPLAPGATALEEGGHHAGERCALPGAPTPASPPPHPTPGPALTEYMAFSSSRALACLIASASSLSFRSILQRDGGSQRRRGQATGSEGSHAILGSLIRATLLLSACGMQLLVYGLEIHY